MAETNWVTGIISPLQSGVISPYLQLVNKAHLVDDLVYFHLNGPFGFGIVRSTPGSKKAKKPESQAIPQSEVVYKTREFPLHSGKLKTGWFIMENLIKMDDLGVPLFLETPMYSVEI